MSQIIHSQIGLTSVPVCHSHLRPHLLCWDKISLSRSGDCWAPPRCSRSSYKVLDQWDQRTRRSDLPSPLFWKKKKITLKKFAHIIKHTCAKKKNLKDKCAFLKFNVWVSFSYEFLKCSLMQLTWVQLLYSLPFMKKNVDFRYQRIFRTKHTPSMFFRWSNHFINECLSWSKKHDKDAKNDFFTKPENSSVDIKWILHVSIH